MIKTFSLAASLVAIMSAAPAMADCQTGTICETGHVMFHSANTSCFKVFVAESGNLYALQYSVDNGPGLSGMEAVLASGGVLSIVTDGRKTSCGTDTSFTHITAVRGGGPLNP